MKRALISLFVLGTWGIMAGCSRPKYDNNAGPTITPGVGIAGVLEIGMTLEDVKHNTGDLVVEENEYTGTISLYVPSLGASWSQRTKADRITQINFNTGLSNFVPVTPMSRLPSFRGALAGVLSFASEQGVRRADLVQVFGKPQQSFDFSMTNIPPGAFQSFAKTVHGFTDKGESVAIKTAPHTEIIGYPQLGIGFALRSNIVYVVGIQKKIEPSGPANGSQQIRSDKSQ
jgi:hypothetical protein